MRWRRWAAALFVLVVASQAASGPSGIQRTPEFVKRVDVSASRAVVWLRKAQAADGSFAPFPTFEAGTTALAYHALRAAGVPKTDFALRRAWDSVRREYRRTRLRTYSAALCLMAISSHGDPVPNTADDRDVTLSPEDAAWAAELTGLLASGQLADGSWAYDLDPPAPGTPRVRSDRSNAQYALLGLKAAARCGVRIEPSVWKKALVHFLETQDLGGPGTARRGDPRPADEARGWGYDHGDDRRYAAMTAGGVSSVVICRSELLGTEASNWRIDAEAERAAWDGLAWLGSKWIVPRKTTDAAIAPAVPNCYAIYGVERAGVLAGVEWMGELDWYAAGAETLLATQAKDGSWTGPELGFGVSGEAAASSAAHRVADTCFALLFLKKGTPAVARGAVTQSAAGPDREARERTARRDLDEFVDLLIARWRFGRWHGGAWKLGKQALSAGTGVVGALIERLGDADAERSEAAFQLLHVTTGLEFEFASSRDPAKRDESVAKWRAWWLAAKDRLVFDAASDRFVER